MNELRLIRILSLSGLAFAALQVAGDLTIGDFPDGHTSPSALTRYYSGHHSQVGLGGELMSWSVVFLGLFCGVLVWRARRFPIGAAIVAVGAGAAVAHEEFSASTYSLLGSMSTSSTLDPAALQAWHLTGSEFGTALGQVVLLLGVAFASLWGRCLSAWIGWSAVVIAAGHLTPLGFLASLLFLLWSAVVGVTLAIRTRDHTSVKQANLELQHS